VIPSGVSHPAASCGNAGVRATAPACCRRRSPWLVAARASILIDSPTKRPNPPQPKTAEHALELWLQQAMDLRRAAGALVPNLGVPATRLAFSGHSYGATLGGVIAAGERHFRALVLMGGYASISDSILHPKEGPPGEPRSSCSSPATTVS